MPPSAAPMAAYVPPSAALVVAYVPPPAPPVCVPPLAPPVAEPASSKSSGQFVLVTGKISFFSILVVHFLN